MHLIKNQLNLVAEFQQKIYKKQNILQYLARKEEQAMRFDEYTFLRQMQDIFMHFDIAN